MQECREPGLSRVCSPGHFGYRSELWLHSARNLAGRLPSTAVQLDFRYRDTNTSLSLTPSGDTIRAANAHVSSKRVSSGRLKYFRQFLESKGAVRAPATNG
jgi:hypothetical protein